MAFFAEPRHYADRTRRVTRVDTHFATIFLTERFAYKLKKPARQGGMDYRTLEARRRGCEEELALNQPLAPGVYLDVLPVIARAGRYAIGANSRGAQGRVVDWLVRMRRLPARHFLDHLVSDPSLREASLEPVVRRLADFYTEASPARMSATRYVASQLRRVATDHRALARFGSRLDQDKVTRVFAAQKHLLESGAPEVGARGARLVDGHGDLRAEHVCLAPLAIIDRLEFDRSLRRLDPAEDVALLALEMERAGRGELGDFLLRRLAQVMSDRVPRWLTHLYMSRRAAIRAKLAAWHVDDPRYPRTAPWLALAEALLDAADDHARRAVRARARVSA
jgi:aminoglycoside phosphotransferase family enzyme